MKRFINGRSSDDEDGDEVEDACRSRQAKVFNTVGLMCGSMISSLAFFLLSVNLKSTFTWRCLSMFSPFQHRVDSKPKPLDGEKSVNQCCPSHLKLNTSTGCCSDTYYWLVSIFFHWFVKSKETLANKLSCCVTQTFGKPCIRSVYTHTHSILCGQWVYKMTDYSDWNSNI